MGVDHRILRHSGQFRGLDKRSSDIDRTIEYSSNMKNAAYRSSGDINKRKGFHSHLTNTSNSYGMITFNNVDVGTETNPGNGAVTEELLMVSDNLYRLKENNFTVSRSVSAQIASLFTLTATGVLSGTGVFDDRFKLSVPISAEVLPDNSQVFCNSATDTVNSDNEPLYLKIISSTTKRIPDPSNPNDRITVTEYTLEGESTPLSNGTATTLNLHTGPVWVDLLLDGDTENFRFKVTDLNTDVVLVNENLDDGINTGMSVGALTNIVNAKTGLGCTYTESDGTAIPEFNSGQSPNPRFNIRAALMDVTFNQVVSPGENFTIKVKEWEEVPGGSFSAYSAYDATNNPNSLLKSEELENASFAVLNNVLYIANGVDELMKYDGSEVYRAGVPEPETFTATITGTGSNEYVYGIIYKFTDAKQNTFSSRMKTLEVTATGPSNVSINLPNITELGFKNNSITVEIYRTIAGAGLAGPFYRIGSQTYTDNAPPFTNSNLDDAIDDLNNAYILPGDLTHDLPPKGKYLSVYKNSLVISGQPTNVNNVSFSLAASEIIGEKGSEAFPSATNQILVESSFGDKISAIASLRDSLFVFHKNSIHALIGEINDDQGVTFVSDLITKEGQLGCESNSSITEIGNKLMFLSKNGLYTIDASSSLSELSSLINPLFDNNNLAKRRAVSQVWADQQLVIIQIPSESSTTNITYTTNKGLVVAYDLFRGAWLQWDNLDFSAGLTLYDEKLFFASRKSNMSILSSFSQTESAYDYSDHTSPVKFSYDTNWESVGEPTVFKKYLRLKIYSFDQNEDFESDFFDLDVSIQKNYLDSDTGSINFDFGKAAGNGWGENPWGQEPWGDATLNFLKTKLPTGKSKCLKLRFRNVDVNENVLISKYELEIAAPFRTEIKE